MDYRNTLRADYSHRIKEFAGRLQKPFHHKFFSIFEDGTLTIRAGYAWDGSTGVPDGDIMEFPPPGLSVQTAPGDGICTTTRGSLFHDLLYQFLERIASLLGMAVRQLRLIADKLYRYFIETDGFGMFPVYYWGVRILGGVYHSVRAWFK